MFVLSVMQWCSDQWCFSDAVMFSFGSSFLQSFIWFCNYLTVLLTWIHMVSLRSARQDAPNVQHFDQFWPHLALRSRDLRPNFDLDLSGSKLKYFDAPRRDEHDGVRIIVLALFVQKLSVKNIAHRKSLTWPVTSSNDLEPWNRVPSVSSQHGQHASFCREALTKLGAKREA